MSTTLHYTLLAVTAASATTAASGYPALNVANERIGKPWRSTDLTQQQITLDLGAVASVASLWLQETNAASVMVESAVTTTAYVTAGRAAIYAEPHGRRKGWVSIAASARYLRATLASAGAASSGEAYWYVGSVFAFANKAALPKAPEWGATITANFPQITQALANGRTVQATAGNAFSSIQLDFRVSPTQDSMALLRRARTATVGLDLGDTSRPWCAWPVRHIGGNSARRLEMYEEDSQGIELTEQV